MCVVKTNCAKEKTACCCHRRSWVQLTTSCFSGYELFVKKVFYLAAFSLKCYDCESSTDMESCDAKRKEKNCTSFDNRCATQSFEYKIIIDIKQYKKYCTTQDACDASKKVCNAANGKKCEIECCDTDNCNDGAAPVVSVLLMVACAFLSSFR